MPFLKRQGSEVTQILGSTLRNSLWTEKQPITLKTDPHMTDTGSVTLIRYFSQIPNLATIPAALLAKEYQGTGLYVVSTDIEQLSPNIIQATCSLEGCCSPKHVKRTFSGTRKELTFDNPSIAKKLQAEYPSYQDEWLEGPGCNATPLADPPKPQGYWYITDKIYMYEPFGWVVLGDDYEQIPQTPFVRRTKKVQWYWEKEPAS